MIELVLVILSLLVSIASFVYTWLSNSPKCEIVNTSLVEQNDYKQTLIYFDVLNSGSSSFGVSEIKLFKDDIEVFDNQFEPIKFEKTKYEEQLKNYEPTGDKVFDSINKPVFRPNEDLTHDTFARNFILSFLLLPGNRQSFSYFVDDIPNKILIISTHRINGLKKETLLPVTFYDQT